MITTLIFSKNRACQLDLLLSSIEKNFHVSNDIIVLYSATTNDFKEGYKRARIKFKNVTFIPETDFKTDTLEILACAQDFTCFFVDDNIVYNKPFITPKHINELFKSSNVGCFSFRLGLNITHSNCYSDRLIQPLPNFVSVTINNIKSLAWHWPSLPMHYFGYPFSVDGCVYPTKFLQETLTYEFDTPNALEGRFKQQLVPPILCCLETSSVVNNPINLVGSSQNKAGAKYSYTLEELNHKYLNGYTIDLYSICKNKINCCHQEMKIIFNK